jgi:tetratricopeptide (TPR) repeat protein
MSQGNFERAAASYDAAVRKQPLVDPAIAVRAFRAKREIGAPDALSFVERWAAARPQTEIAAQKLLANAYSDFRMNDRAIAIYEKLVAVRGDDIALINNLAVLYSDRDPEKALTLAKRAADAAPGSPAVLDTYGWLLVRQGKFAEGFGMLRNAHLRAPNVPEIRFHMAVALDGLGRKADALREVTAALRAGSSFDGADEAEKLRKRLSAP